MPEGARISAPPHPFVIEPPLTDLRQYQAGEPIECGLILFGDEADASTHCLGCRNIRKFFNGIGEDSPEKYLERTRGALMEMPVKTPVQ